MYSALRARIDQWVGNYPRLNGKLSDIKETIRKRARSGANYALIDMDFLAESKDEFFIVVRILETLGYQYKLSENGLVLQVFW